MGNWSLGIIQARRSYVSSIQVEDRAKLHEGILRDEERQARRREERGRKEEERRENTEQLLAQQQLEARYRETEDSH